MIGMGTKTLLTLAEFFELPEDETVRYELSEGELITMSNPEARTPHERTKSRVLRPLFVYRDQHPEAGEVFAEASFVLGPAIARIPDVAFVSAARVALWTDAEGLDPAAPDIAIEVISNSETAAGAEKKVREYLAAGVREVWQVYPEQRRVRIHTSDRVYDLTQDQILETPVMPGFSVKVSCFFA